MIDLHLMDNGEEQKTYELIVRVFHNYVAPVYSENGIGINLIDEAMGFEIQGDEIDEGGMRFTPMRKVIDSCNSKQGFCSGVQRAAPTEKRRYDKDIL